MIAACMIAACCRALPMMTVMCRGQEVEKIIGGVGAANSIQKCSCWTVGAGLEYAIASNWSVKVEGLYYKLENKTLVFTDFGTGNYPNQFTDDGVLVRVGANYKFGGPVVAKY
jgi:opacity protein-like surface antigen